MVRRRAVVPGLISLFALLVDRGGQVLDECRSRFVTFGRRLEYSTIGSFRVLVIRQVEG